MTSKLLRDFWLPLNWFLIEEIRTTASTEDVLARARSIGRKGPHRTDSGRRRLRRLVRAVDRLVPGSNCLRRVLWEIVSDAGAAQEKVSFGFVLGGGVESGHVWFDSAESPDRSRFHSVFSL